MFACRSFLLAPLAAATLLTALVARPAAAQFGTNLVVNPGAEAAAGSPSGAVVPVPGWTATGGFTATSYAGGGGFPVAGSPGPADRGANFFAGGPTGASSSGQQTLDLTGFGGLTASIDAGEVGYTLAAFLGGFDRQNDHATFTAEFLGGDLARIGAVTLGPVLASDRGNETGLFARSAMGMLPTGTRSVVFTLQMNRLEGIYNDGYADNLSFVLTAAPATTVPEPGTWALLGSGLLAIGGVAARRHRATS